MDESLQQFLSGKGAYKGGVAASPAYTPTDITQDNLPDFLSGKISGPKKVSIDIDPKTGRIKIAGPKGYLDSPEFKEQVLPLYQQLEGRSLADPDFAKLTSPDILSKIQRQADEIIKYQKSVTEIKQQLSSTYGLDDAGGNGFIDTYQNFKQSGMIKLPNGSSIKINDAKAELKGLSDAEKGSVISSYHKLLTDKDAPMEARGRAAAVLDIINEEKLNIGSSGQQFGYAVATVGKHLVKGAYSLADTLIPDRWGKVAKFDQSEMAKQVDAKNEALRNLTGYDAYIAAGDLIGELSNIGISLVAGNKLTAASKLLAIRSLNAAGQGIRQTGASLAVQSGFADEAMLLTTAGDGLIGAARYADKLAEWVPKSKAFQAIVDAPAQAATYTALTKEEDKTFGEQFLKETTMFLAINAGMFGLGWTWAAARKASEQVTVQGIKADATAELTSAMIKDTDDVLKVVGDGKGRYNYEAVTQIDDVTDGVLDSAHATKNLSEAVDNGFLARVDALTAEQSAELFLHGHKTGVAEKILGKDMAKELRLWLDSKRAAANRLGLKIDYRENYWPRTGAVLGRRTGRRTNQLKNVSASEKERVFESGEDLLRAEGELADVSLGNLLRNYAAEISAASLNRIATMRLLQGGQIVRVAADGSAALRAAKANGGIVKVTKTINGEPITVGYAATRDWLAEAGYIRIDNRVVNDTLKHVQKATKNYESGFYARPETIQKITNYAEASTDRLTRGIIGRAAQLSSRMQDVVLSGGIPFAPVNAFAIAQLMGAMMANPTNFKKYAEIFGRAFSEGATRKYWLQEMYAEGANLTTAAENGINIIRSDALGTTEVAARGIRADAAAVSAQNQLKALTKNVDKLSAELESAQSVAVKARQKVERMNERVADAELKSRVVGEGGLPVVRSEALAKRQANLKAAEDAQKTAEETVEKLSKELDEARAAREGVSEANMTYEIFSATGNKAIAEGKEFATDIGKIWDKTVADATFKRLTPMLQWETTKYIVNKGLKQGLSESAAYGAGRTALKRFWNIRGVNDFGIAGKLGADTTAVRDTLKDITTIFILAPRYRATMITRWWNTIKLADPRKLTKLENRLNLNWAMSGLALFTLFNVAQKAVSGRYTWENPTGAIDELQIPLEDGDILRLSVWGSQGSFVRNLGRIGNAALRGEGDEVVNESLSLGSVMVQPVARATLNEDFFGNEIGEDGDLIDRAKYILGSYVAHPYLKALTTLGEGESLKAALGAVEAPIRTSNIDKSLRGEFFGQVVPDVEAIANRYSKQINAAFDNEEEKTRLFTEMIDKIQDRVTVWAERYNQDPSNLDDEMARSIVRAIVDAAPFSLGGMDTFTGQQQVHTQAAMKTRVREEAEASGLDLYTYGDATTDLLADVYGTPKQVAYEFAQVMKGDRKQGIPSMYDIERRYFDQIDALYERARGLRGAEAQAIYNEISRLQEEYMTNEFDPRIRPLIEKYGPQILLNNKEIFEEIGSRIMVPGDFTPFTSRKKQPYQKDDVEAYLLDRYGVGKINQGNLPTDQEAQDIIARVRADLAAGRTASAQFKLGDLQDDIGAGRVYVDQEAMNAIRTLIEIANKR